MTSWWLPAGTANPPKKRDWSGVFQQVRHSAGLSSSCWIIDLAEHDKSVCTSGYFRFNAMGIVIRYLHPRERESGMGVTPGCSNTTAVERKIDFRVNQSLQTGLRGVNNFKPPPQNQAFGNTSGFSLAITGPCVKAGEYPGYLPPNVPT